MAFLADSGNMSMTLSDIRLVYFFESVKKAITVYIVRPAVGPVDFGNSTSAGMRIMNVMQ